MSLLIADNNLVTECSSAATCERREKGISFEYRAMWQLQFFGLRLCMVFSMPCKSNPIDCFSPLTHEVF